MSTHKHIDLVCLLAAITALALTLLFMNGTALGIAYADRVAGYESRLFDTASVHKIDLVMDDWDGFIEGCESEEYTACTAVIDGESYRNIGIRAKGNTSLSNVSSLGSQRYSFKLEFDQYESGKSYYGLDKLCLNNLIQDNTMMKDYLVYQMMGDFGAESPLCSFVYITVNGEDWGLYLAVEGVEDSFLTRNYGADAGELYKPDSISFGGGRGNGQNFNIDEFDWDAAQTERRQQTTQDAASQTESTPQTESPPDLPSGDAAQSAATPQLPQGKGGMGGMGSDDVKLKYIDDDPESYANIFDNAKTDVSGADQERLIASLKNLSAYTQLEDTLDIDEVLRYFVVHNFVCNGDSYTGSIIHNYYLHEQDGKLSMIPWDYNLAFGTFQGGSASDAVNASIDAPVSGGDVDDRPMFGWIFSDAAYTAQYHELFGEFIETWYESGKLTKLIDDTAALLRPYVDSDPTKFCTTEEFETGVAALSQFVTLRAQAVSSQLSGDSTAVDTGTLNLSDMGSMGSGGMKCGNFGSFSAADTNTTLSAPPTQSGETADTGDAASDAAQSDSSGAAQSTDRPQRPQGGFGGTLPDGTELPSDMQPPQWDGTQSENGSTQSETEGTQQMPGNFRQDTAAQTAAQTDTQQTLDTEILLGVSLLVLAAGLLVAKKFKA